PDDIFTMGGSSSRVRIPSVMIGYASGSALRTTSNASATLRLKTVLPGQKDGDLDSDIVYHEYGHGLTWRMIGGMSGPLAGAIGEGMGDGLSMLINGDDIVGEYSSSNPLGIRRFRYAGYPLTYKDVTGAEVHDDGEIYAAIVWRMIELFGTGGRERLFTHVVQGMNYTPSTPSYEQMRDGILQAVSMGPTPDDRCTVWSAFAQYGVGVGAKGTVSRRGALSVTESITKPIDCP
ncbi:MAG: M36 family metallopeptidase, partial [Rubrivivax sp.]|nr:M36 family metallopeptidase [Rubrivivax sp.]